MSGETKNWRTLEDKEMGIEVQNSIKLVRTVEVYQWKEYKQKSEASEYRLEWS